MKKEQMINAECPAQIDGKPNVGCCASVETAMQSHIIRLKQLRNLYQIGTPQHNCFSIAVNEAMVELVKEKTQLVDAFTAGQIDIAKTLGEAISERYVEKITVNEFENDKEDGEEYFNNTFKK